VVKAKVSLLLLIFASVLKSSHLRPPEPLLMRLFDPLLKQLHSKSKSCKFLLYTVSVIGPVSESHHFNVYRPAHVPPGCAVFILLENNSEKSIFTTSKVDSLATELQSVGWSVVSRSINIPQAMNRRLSRFPKILPGYFFPHSTIVLYHDVKLSPMLLDKDAYTVANTLLRDGASFGIVQHERSDSLAHEIENIELAATKRRLVDSLRSLQLQWLQLFSLLSSSEQMHAGVEGRLKASRIKGRKNSALFERVWLEEYLSGSDRDQIAFYSAFARMQLEIEYLFPCNKYHRSGQYRSKYDKKTTLNIHCSLSSLLQTARVELAKLDSSQSTQRHTR